MTQRKLPRPLKYTQASLKHHQQADDGINSSHELKNKMASFLRIGGSYVMISSGLGKSASGPINLPWDPRKATSN